MALDLRLNAFVSEQERRAVFAATEQFSEALSVPLGYPPPVKLTLLPSGDPLPSGQAPPLLASPLADPSALTRPMQEIETVWRERLGGSIAAAQRTVVLCTIFRHVPEGPQRASVLERIRRLNLLVIYLSQEFGTYVADIDQAVSFFGARRAQSDYRLNSMIAAEIAGHVITRSLFEAAPDMGISDPQWRSAANSHGQFSSLTTIVDRRLAAKQGKANA